MMENQEQGNTGGLEGGGKKPRRLLVVMILGPAILLVLILSAILSIRAMFGGHQVRAVEVLPVNVQVQVVQPIAALPDTFDMDGTVEPDRVVRVSSEVAGRIEKIDAEEGAPCRAGDKLVFLNTDLLLAQAQRERAQAEFDKREYDQVADLQARGVATASELDRARTKSAASGAVYDEIKARLDRAVVVAPVGGVLNRIPVEVGEYLREGDLVAEIVDMASAKVVVNVPQHDVQQLTVGGEETILLSEEPPRTLTGKIGYISELDDEKTRTTRVEIVVDNSRKLLRSGQFVGVRLTRRVLKDVILVPLEAVIPLESGREVYVVEDGKARNRPVTLGILLGRSVQVTGGLAPGDKLITTGQRYVGAGQRVNIVESQ